MIDIIQLGWLGVGGFVCWVLYKGLLAYQQKILLDGKREEIKIADRYPPRLNNARRAASFGRFRRDDFKKEKVKDIKISVLLKERLDICLKNENYEECVIIKKLLDIAKEDG